MHTSHTAKLLTTLGDLLLQIRLRNLYAPLLDFLKSEGLSPGRGWGLIEQKIEEFVADSPDPSLFIEHFETFVRESVLLSQKRIYCLKFSNFDPMKLGASAAGNIRLDYLAGNAPARPSSDHVGHIIGQWTLGRATITSFVTQRVMRKNETVDKQSLNKSGLVKYQNADLVAKFYLQFRCYDHVVKIGNRAFLLVDSPDGIDTKTVDVDAIKYQHQIADLVKQLPENILEDFFPAVESIYKDSSEGIINSLSFMSNNLAQVKGNFSASSNEDYRKHPFQQAGEKAATVLPYRIAVKWLAHPEQPVVDIPGQASMVAGTLGSHGTYRIPLRHISFPFYTKWDGFAFAVDRVLGHI